MSLSDDMMEQDELPAALSRIRELETRLENMEAAAAPEGRSEPPRPQNPYRINDQRAAVWQSGMNQAWKAWSERADRATPAPEPDPEAQGAIGEADAAQLERLKAMPDGHVKPSEPEDRSEPPPDYWVKRQSDEPRYYDVGITNDQGSPLRGTVEVEGTEDNAHARAVAYCWRHRDEVLASAKRVTPGSTEPRSSLADDLDLLREPMKWLSARPPNDGSRVIIRVGADGLARGHCSPPPCPTCNGKRVAPLPMGDGNTALYPCQECTPAPTETSTEP